MDVLAPLADLAVKRIMLADKVAAAKFGTGRPIDDPVREQQVLDDVAAQSVRLGLAPQAGVRFFRAQLAANKIVQRGLFEHWTEHPGQRPAHRPDLAAEVRPELDLITGELLEQLRVTLMIRPPGAECACCPDFWIDLVDRLDKLHRRAVMVSLRPVCAL